MLNRLLCCVGPMRGGTNWLMWHLRHSADVFFAPEKEIHYHYSRAFWPEGISGRRRVLQLLSRLTGRKSLWSDSQISAGYRAKVTARYAERFARHAPQDPEALPAAMEGFRANLRWYNDYMSEPVNEAWYDRIFGGAGHKWPCDFSATTCMIGTAGLHLMKRSAKDVRIIYFIRNPYDRLWSHAKWHAMLRGHWRDFEEMSASERVSSIRRYKLHKHSFYADRIKRMRRVFGSDKVLVLSFDDIEKNPEKLLSLVSDFLGIPTVPVKEDLRARHAASPEMPIDWDTMKPFAKEFDKEIDKLSAMGFGVAKTWDKAPK